MLADDMMESSADILQQEAMETETDSWKLGVGSNVRLLTSYLCDMEK